MHNHFLINFHYNISLHYFHLININNFYPQSEDLRQLVGRKIGTLVFRCKNFGFSIPIFEKQNNQEKYSYNIKCQKVTNLIIYKSN